MVQVAKDATSVILWAELVDEQNDPLSGITYDDSDLSVYKLQPGDTALQAVTLVEGTVGTYLENSWIEIGDGLYQFCPPDSWVVENQSTLVEFSYPGIREQRDLIEATAGGTTASSSSSSSIDTSATIFDSSTMEINLTRGDDYLVANDSNIDILVDDDVGDISVASSSAFFKASNAAKTATVSGSASVVQVNGNFYIRLVFTRAQTSAATAGTYNWDAEIQDDNGYVRTRVTGSLVLTESWTDIVS